MARQTLVMDASVGVKWFSEKDEPSLQQALMIRESHMAKALLIVVPDLFYYEVSNAIVKKKFIPVDEARAAIAALFLLRLQTAYINSELLSSSIELSRKSNITVYDSYYLALARIYNCPLVTANPKHQRPDLGCQVIPLEQWKA